MILGLLFLTFIQGDFVREVTGLEQQLLDALVRLDVTTVQKLWSDDLVFVGTDGKVTTRAERLTGMKASSATAGASVTAATNDDVKVRLYGQVAVVTLLSTWKGRANDREFSDRYMTTHVWSRQNGRWLLVSAHVSRLPQ